MLKSLVFTLLLLSVVAFAEEVAENVGMEETADPFADKPKLKIGILKEPSDDSSHRIGLGDTVSVHYRGKLVLESEEKVFDSSFERGQPFSFQIGARKVIPGMERCLYGAAVDEIRRCSIPAWLGYGEREVPGPDDTVLIPANSDLVFDVMVVEIEPKPIEE
ncbi:hypothetical protein PCE1_000032 [Barthelona sp. PCE]